MRSMFHAGMSVLFLIAYYLSGRFWVLALVSFLWACLYVLDVSLALKVMFEKEIREKDDEDCRSKQDD